MAVNELPIMRLYIIASIAYHTFSLCCFVTRLLIHVSFKWMVLIDDIRTFSLHNRHNAQMKKPPTDVFRLKSAYPSQFKRCLSSEKVCFTIIWTACNKKAFYFSLKNSFYFRYLTVLRQNLRRCSISLKAKEIKDLMRHLSHFFFLSDTFLLFSKMPFIVHCNHQQQVAVKQ
jgi:hypothetical protein